MQHKDPPSKKERLHHHSTLRAIQPVCDWKAADALNEMELRSLQTRGKSISIEEGRELVETPKIIGDAIINLEQSGNLSPKRAPKLKGPE